MRFLLLVFGVVALSGPVQAQQVSQEAVREIKPVEATQQLPSDETDTETPTVYIDVWERPVAQLEDESLLDAGLQGADTSSRDQTNRDERCGRGTNRACDEEKPDL